MRTDPDELEKRRLAALAHIKRRPGISQDELAVAIGLRARIFKKTKSGRYRTPRNVTVTRLIQSLVASGEIWAAKDEFADDRDPLKCYPAGYVKPQKTLFQSARDRALGECKTYFDPSVAGNSSAPKPLDYIPVAPECEPAFITRGEKPMNRNAQEIEEAVKDAIAYLQGTGKPFTQQAVIYRARINHGMLTARLELLNLVKKAVAASNPLGLAEPPVEDDRPEKEAYEPKLHFTADPKTQALIQMVNEVTPEDVKAAIAPRVQELEAQVSELQRQNEELRQQLAQQPSGYLEGLRQEEMLCKSTLKRIEADFQQLEDDRRAALANLLLIRRLIAAKTDEDEPPIELELVVPANGNGHRLEVTSHA